MSSCPRSRAAPHRCSRTPSPPKSSANDSINAPDVMCRYRTCAACGGRPARYGDMRSADAAAMIPTPVKAVGPRRREDILRIATELFAARGYHGTRMDDLADAVGLNKATLYHYYSSKSLLLFD